VGAHEFIERMPDRYDTKWASGGGQLWAGQRQLVAFAKAAAADPRAAAYGHRRRLKLVLDERETCARHPGR
jgi:ABC-type protease/lipase transport system fused ATPase/permease subunit